MNASILVRHVLKLSVLPLLETRLLLETSTQKSRTWLIAHDDYALSDQEYQTFQDLYQKRTSGVPMAFILEQKEFLGRMFYVTPDTLIPRPDTEVLVETVLEAIAPIRNPVLLELGTGTGIIAISIALARPDATIFASDISEAALKVARQNAQTHQATIHWLCGSWFEALPVHADLTFDGIISNPPYIHKEDPHLTQGDLRFEPRHALTDEANGLQALEHIISHAPTVLKPHGKVWLEHGYDQGEQVRDFFHKQGYTEVISRRDLANHERVTYGNRPSEVF